MKMKGFDHSEEGRKILAIKTDSLNQSMKNLIELQKNLEHSLQPSGNEQFAELIQQYVQKEKAAAERLERDHQQKLLQTMSEGDRK